MMAQALAPPPPEPQQLSLADLRAVSMLGRGAKGVVFHVVPEGEGGAGDVAMALKSVSREAARHKKSGGSGGGYGHRRIWFERDVLLALRHPLLPALRGVLATRCRLRDRPLRRRRPQLPPTPPDREDVLRLRHTPQQTLLRITALLGKKYT